MAPPPSMAAVGCNCPCLQAQTAHCSSRSVRQSGTVDRRGSQLVYPLLIHHLFNTRVVSFSRCHLFIRRSLSIDSMGTQRIERPNAKGIAYGNAPSQHKGPSLSQSETQIDSTNRFDESLVLPLTHHAALRIAQIRSRRFCHAHTAPLARSHTHKHARTLSPVQTTPLGRRRLGGVCRLLYVSKDERREKRIGNRNNPIRTLTAYFI